MYSMRRGGYRSSLQHLKDGNKNDRVPNGGSANPYGVQNRSGHSVYGQNVYGQPQLYNNVYGNMQRQTYPSQGAAYNQFAQASTYQPRGGNNGAHGGYYPPPGSAGRNGYR